MASFIDDKLLYKLIGKKIKMCREKGEAYEEKVTQEALAKVLGVTRVSIANYEAGTQAISVFDVYRIANFLGVDALEFFPSMEMVRLSEPEVNLDTRDNLTDEERDAIRKLIMSTSVEGEANER